MPVTIAIPFFNAENYILDSIRSIFAQTYTDWELFLIDDGSTDNSLKLVQKIDDPRVKIISDGKNKRLAGRLNEVPNYANFDFILRMDADDMIFPTKIKRQLDIFETFPDLDIVTTGVYSVTNDLKIQGVRGMDYYLPEFDDIISRRKGVVHAAMMVKKSWYTRNKYDESLKIAQDLDLWIRASKANDFKIKSINEYLYIYREEGNVTKDKLLRAYSNERAMIRKYAISNKFKLITKSYLKSLVVRGLALFGRINSLQKRRSDFEISATLQNEFQLAINTIKSTKIPGIDV